MCHLKLVHHDVGVKITDSIVVVCPADATSFATPEEPWALPDNLTQELCDHVLACWYT